MTLDRRNMLSGLGAVGLATAAPALGQRRKKGLPNIVFIMADDLGYADLGCTGSRQNKTPHIDSIAQNGVRFTQGYANSSICSPTRTGLITGCYQYRFDAGLEEPIGPGSPRDIGVPFDRKTIAETMRDAGYETALIGKWHLGSPPLHSPLAHGYDTFFGIVPGGVDYFRHKVVMGGRDLGVGILKDNEEVQRAGYLTDLFGDEAVATIRRKRGPLFLSLHFTAVHWPWEDRDSEEESRQLKDFFHLDGGSLETYANMVAAMDDNVGKVLDALREIGELDNTLIVFTSDNGGERFSDTWPFIGIKGELFEGGIRVPLLAQWPDRIAADSHSDQVMISMDFLPTFAAIGGKTVQSKDYDGMELSRQLVDGASPQERTLYWRMRSNEQAAMRQGDWKYLRIAGRNHLFNFARDQRERANLAERHPAKLRELQRNWDSWNREMLPYPSGGYVVDNRDYFTDRF